MLLWCNNTVDARDAREQLGYVMLTLYQISLRRHENHLVQAFVHIRSVILVRISVTERTCASPIVNKKLKKKAVPTFLTCSQWLNCEGTREVRSDVSM